MAQHYKLKVGQNLMKYYEEFKESWIKELIDIFRGTPSEHGIQDLVYCGMSPEESTIELNISHYQDEIMKERHIPVHYPADAKKITVNHYTYRIISVTPEELILEYIIKEKNEKC